MQDEFSSVLDQIESNDEIKACVLISKKEGCFVAGADIQMINKVTSVEEGAAMSRGGQEMFGRIEKSHKPFLAAINGPALGGKHHNIGLNSEKYQNFHFRAEMTRMNVRIFTNSDIRYLPDNDFFREKLKKNIVIIFVFFPQK